MDAPPPPPTYPPPQQRLIIKEAQNYAGESARTWDSPQRNQPLSSKSPRNTLPRTLSVGSDVFNFTAESKPNFNRVNIDSDLPKRDREMSNYIRKEQQLRAQQLEKEKYLWSSAYMARRVVSTATVRTLPTQASGDFHNTDWTPQDSAYGAAFPFCGWIPKGLREAVERILVAVALVTVVYTIVTVGMKLTNGITRTREDTQDANNPNVYTDDDFYVEETTYSQMYYDDTDDLFNDDDGSDDANRIRQRQ